MQPVRMTLPILDATPAWLRRFTKLVAASTLFLIFAGAMVTSTGSGLAVPDWPLSYGMLMPPMVGGIFYEHGHRMIAATVGFLTVLQAMWLQRREPKRFLRLLGWWSVAAVIAQGLLGGLTVKLLLPKSVSIAHAGLAEIFLCLNVAIAFFASKAFLSLRSYERGDAPVASTTSLVALIYAQILAGALMRHLGAGLAIPQIWVVPAFTSPGVIVNFAHRIGGILVAAVVVTIAIRLSRFDPNHPLRIVANFLLLFVATQILMGVYTVLSLKQPVITSLHVMIGALTFGTSLVLALTARAVAWRAEKQASGLGPRASVEAAA